MGALAAAKISALIQHAQISSLRSDSTQKRAATNSASSPTLICSPMRQLVEILRADFSNLLKSAPPTSCPRLSTKRHSTPLSSEFNSQPTVSRFYPQLSILLVKIGRMRKRKRRETSRMDQILIWMSEMTMMVNIQRSAISLTTRVLISLNSMVKCHKSINTWN